MVTVSPQNSAIVWAVDTENQIYAREGIFNDKSDADCLIAGIDWVAVDPVAGTVKLISASIDCVWVLSNLNHEDRLFKRIELIHQVTTLELNGKKSSFLSSLRINSSGFQVL